MIHYTNKAPSLTLLNNLNFYFLGQIAYRLLDHGTANILGLKTFYHGTCLPNYLSIRVRGGLRSKGASSTGATLGNSRDDTSNAFYLLKDSQTECHNIEALPYAINLLFNNRIVRYLGFAPINAPSCFALLSTANFLLSILPAQFSYEPKVRLFIILLAYFCPAPFLNFKYDAIPESFEDDPMAPFAYKTHQDHSPLRIGLLGSVYASCTANVSWCERVKEDPIKPLIGLAEMVAFAYLSKYLVNAVAYNKSAQLAVIAGLILS